MQCAVKKAMQIKNILALNSLGICVNCIREDGVVDLQAEEEAKLSGRKSLRVFAPYCSELRWTELIRLVAPSGEWMEDVITTVITSFV